MSGFAGILNRDGRPVDRSLLDRMAAYMGGFAPDAQDVWVDESTGLCHALLKATFESERERQPCSLDGHVWVAADARIDGRAEVLAALRGAGRSIENDVPDPEIILHAYHAWGEECVGHLIGDFSFAIWDTHRQTLFCARDHFGVVPFFYAETPTGLIFSNALSCLRLHPDVSDRLNERAIGDFLLLSMNMNVDTTMFEEIRRLPPAHTLTWRAGSMRLRQYWVPPEREVHVRQRPQEHVERFGAVFELAVADRLRTDRAGTQMSGGMDSTSVSVVAKMVLAARGKPFDLRAYTIVYEWLLKEAEGTYSNAVATHSGIPVEQLRAEEFIVQEPDAEPRWPTPEPAPIANQTAEHEILRRISSFSRTMFTGFGGDPLFAYRRSPWTVSMSRGRLDEVAWDVWQSAWLFGEIPPPGIRTAIRQRLARPPAAPKVPAWVNADFARRLNLAARIEELHAMRPSLTDLRMMRSPYWTNLFTWMHPAFHGCAVRVVMPFFDVRLARLVATIPPVPWRSKKRLLREAMRGLLPETVRQRRKTPLYVPADASGDGNPWYKLSSRAEQQAWRNALVSTADITPYVDVKRVQSFLAAARSEGTGAMPVGCIQLAYWLRHQRRPASALTKQEA
ncbi:MAG: asparagine synthetase B [Vicinamibacterales bacterium]